MKIDTLKVKILMIERNLNQKKLATVAGIRESTLSNIMCGKSKGKSDTWIKIANALGVEVMEIIKEETKKEQTQ